MVFDLVHLVTISCNCCSICAADSDLLEAKARRAQCRGKPVSQRRL